MSNNKLHIFSKGTDSPESQAGFEYQKLKTLETWIFNKVQGINEEIYCDYEEDIFQKGVHKSTLIFRQIKLYSTNFSFSTAEVHKALQHFFMLFVKSDYNGIATEFIFEANSDIARKKGANEANLMREWRDSQGNLSGDLLNRCRVKTKKIITNYIETTYNKLQVTNDNPEFKEQLDEAKAIFYALQPDDFDKFINSIKWRFENITPYQALESIKNKIAGLLEQIPFVFEKERYKFAHGHLLTIISEKSIGETPQDRKLTSELLDHSLLQLGSKEDLWYAEVFAKWSGRNHVNTFLIGQFFEVVDAAKYCRWNPLVHNNKDVWDKLLQDYFAMADIIGNCKRKAIYEYMMLKVQINFLNLELEPGVKELIQYYFSNLPESETFEDLEDAINLHQIITSLITLKKIKLTIKSTLKWSSDILSIITKKLVATENLNSQCAYYELLGHLSFKLRKKNKLTEAVSNSIDFYNKIIPLLPKATMYNVADLSGKLLQMHDLFMKLSTEDSRKAEKLIKAYLEKIEPIVQERKGKNFTAKQHVKWGSSYLQKNGFKRSLDALEEFHKAKILWNQEKTIEGVIVSMMMIAGVYLRAGMNYAAKYYALTALWDSLHINTKNFNRISGCFGIMMLADFEGGAWVSALNDFEKYITSNHMFDTNTLNEEPSSFFTEAVSKEGLLFLIIPQFTTDLNDYIESKKNRLGWFREETIDPLIDGLNKTFSGNDILTKVALKLTDSPLNDVGIKRKISWETQSHSWAIEFENSWALNAIAEEFCAIIQIMQVELSRRDDDMHFIKANISVKLEKSITGKFSMPEKQPSNSHHDFIFSVPEITTVNSDTVRNQYAHLSAAYVSILKDISLLPLEEIDDIVTEMYQQGLADKIFIVNSYQVMLKDFFPEADFVERRSLSFTHRPNSSFSRKLKDILPVSIDLSNKYSKSKSILHIQNRNIVFSRTLHLSFAKWKTDASFIQLVLDLRKANWLDWQILTAINNYSISYKANLHLKDIQFTSEENYWDSLHQEIDRMMNIDEEYCYMEIPISIFLEEEFQFLVKQVPIFTLNSYGLETRSAFPDHEAIRNLLSNRFSFKKDNSRKNNLLVNVK